MNLMYKYVYFIVTFILDAYFNHLYIIKHML